MKKEKDYVLWSFYNDEIFIFYIYFENIFNYCIWNLPRFLHFFIVIKRMLSVSRVSVLFRIENFIYKNKTRLSYISTVSYSISLLNVEHYFKSKKFQFNWVQIRKCLYSLKKDLLQPRNIFQRIEKKFIIFCIIIVKENKI